MIELNGNVKHFSRLLYRFYCENDEKPPEWVVPMPLAASQYAGCDLIHQVHTAKPQAALHERIKKVSAGGAGTLGDQPVRAFTPPDVA